MTLNTGNLRLAIQKDGRLTDETLNFLRRASLLFEVGTKRFLSPCSNFPMEILYLRDDDIAQFVEQGTVDLGIIGQNLLYEQRKKVKKLLNLRFGFCSLVVAVPRDANVKKVKNLSRKKVATPYPRSARAYFKKKNVPLEIISLSGAVEIIPALGSADAIVDLVSTGSTLKLAELKIVDKIADSEAVLIVNPKVSGAKKEILENLLTRFTAVLSAKNYKFVLMTAPRRILPKLTKILPGLPSSTYASLTKDGWASIQSVIKEDVFWETIERLKQLGASGITVLPIEKMIP